MFPNFNPKYYWEYEKELGRDLLIHATLQVKDHDSIRCYMVMDLPYIEELYLVATHTFLPR